MEFKYIRPVVDPGDRPGYDHPTCVNLEPRLRSIQIALSNHSGLISWENDNLMYNGEIVACRFPVRIAYSTVLPRQVEVNAFIKNPFNRGELPTPFAAHNAIFCVNGKWYAAKTTPPESWIATRRLDLAEYPKLTEEFLLSLVTCSAQRS